MPDAQTPPSALAQLVARIRTLQSAEAADPALAARLKDVRAWQAARLTRTYADLAHDPGQTSAIGFFLTDLYGPQDFSARDRQLARAAPLLERTLPRSALQVLIDALELYTLSGELDQTLVRSLRGGPICAESYTQAYRASGRAADRERQIRLIVQIGERLARAVEQPLIGLALRATHVPAHMAGFGALQDFLERGFAAFQHLADAQAFLTAIRTRESSISEALLRGDPSPLRN